MTWATGDVFFVPPWAEHELENLSAQEEAIVYSLQNLPQQALGGTLMRNDPVTGRPVHVRSDVPGETPSTAAGTEPTSR
jgi:gentisate 1,2-dioxygenase